MIVSPRRLGCRGGAFCLCSRRHRGSVAKCGDAIPLCCIGRLGHLWYRPSWAHDTPPHASPSAAARPSASSRGPFQEEICSVAIAACRALALRLCRRLCGLRAIAPCGDELAVVRGTGTGRREQRALPIRTGRGFQDSDRSAGSGGDGAASQPSRQWTARVFSPPDAAIDPGGVAADPACITYGSRAPLGCVCVCVLAPSPRPYDGANAAYRGATFERARHK